MVQWVKLQPATITIHEGAGLCLGCALLNQLPCKVPEKTLYENACTWCLATHQWDLERDPGSGFQPDQELAIVVIWGMNQLMEDLSFLLTFPLFITVPCVSLKTNKKDFTSFYLERPLLQIVSTGKNRVIPADYWLRYKLHYTKPYWYYIRNLKKSIAVFISKGNNRSIK